MCLHWLYFKLLYSSQVVPMERARFKSSRNATDKTSQWGRLVVVTNRNSIRAPSLTLYRACCDKMNCHPAMCIESNYYDEICNKKDPNSFVSAGSLD
jgi:hypothetical protein